MKAIRESARHVVLVIAMVLSGLPGITTYASAEEYQYNELIPAAWSSAAALGINDNGAVVGYGTHGSSIKGFIYSQGVYTALLPPGWNSAQAVSINDNGTVVGYGTHSSSIKGFIYSQGVYTELLPPGWSSAYAVAINEAGAVAGYGSDGTMDKGFVYSEGQYSDTLPPEWSSAHAAAINDSGAVVGYGMYGSNLEGFIYSESVYTDILPPEWDFAYAVAFNKHGAVVGHGNSGSFIQGFIYSAGEYTELLPSGWSSAYAVAINEAGTVTGYGYDGITDKGFVYSKGGYSDILPTGWGYAAAGDINEYGTVVGYGADSAGTEKAFIATPLVVDNCPDDPLKTEPGICGCGVPDNDTDSDAVPDCADNCPSVANSGQEDFDADGTGDPCDTDRDGDNTTNANDCAPDDAAAFKTWLVYADTDADGYGAGSAITLCGNDMAPAGYSVNNTDNCPDAANADQNDADGDGTGDLCDTDRDGDGVANGSDCAPDNAAAFKPWIVYADTDADGYGAGSATSVCGNDTAPAGYSINNTDNCPDAANADQRDADGDGIGDLCEQIQAVDSDNDGIPDSDDLYPYSNMKKRIIIKGYNTGVKSRLFADGSTMNDLIDECYLSNKTSKSHKRDKSHKAFLSCVAKLTQEWKALGFISSREKCVILLIAALVR